MIKDEVQVAEFMPIILLPQGGLVGSLQVLAAGQGLEHMQVAGLGFVKTGQ